MTAREITEREKLHQKWAAGIATHAEVLRCMELDRKAKRELTKNTQAEGRANDE